jgi:hypothetical protein
LSDIPIYPLLCAFWLHPQRSSSNLVFIPSSSVFYRSSWLATSKLANLIRSLAQHARNIPRYFPDSLLNSNSAWTTKTGLAGRFDRRAKEMESTPENKPERAERSYLSAAVESITPWGSSRPSTPKPATTTVPGEGSGLKNQHGGYQSTHQWHGLSSKRYPSDCPPLNARWFYAVDV